MDAFNLISTAFGVFDMASVYKRGRDEKERHSPWWISYEDENGKRRTVKGYTEKRATETLAAKLEDEARMRRDGLVDTDQEKLYLPGAGNRFRSILPPFSGACPMQPQNT
jgi:hypothetical protein